MSLKKCLKIKKKWKTENLDCPVCEENYKVDSQNHFLYCSVINTEINKTINANIEDMYSQEE